MLTFYHSPKTRSSRVLALILDLGIENELDIRNVDIRRDDGTGAVDPANPHPEGKVPVLMHDGVQIWESSAIMLYLTDLFPQSDRGVSIGDLVRGRYLSWLAWYGDVFEPVGIFAGAGIEHPALMGTFRDMAAAINRIETALSEGPWLCGDRYTAADLLVASLFLFYRDATPDVPAIRDWVARCGAHPSLALAAKFEDKTASEKAA